MLFRSYSKSKVESELHARALQEAGHPVLIVYPGGVAGPDDLGLNVVGSYLVNILSSDVLMVGPSGGWALIDVRDIALAVARLMRPGLGPRRFLAQGDLMSFDEFNAALIEVTGLDRSVAPMTRDDLLQVMDEEARHPARHPTGERPTAPAGNRSDVATPARHAPRHRLMARRVGLPRREVGACGRREGRSGHGLSP